MVESKRVPTVLKPYKIMASIRFYRIPEPPIPSCIAAIGPSVGKAVAYPNMAICSNAIKNPIRIKMAKNTGFLTSIGKYVIINGSNKHNGAVKKYVKLFLTLKLIKWP